ncbi:MAG: hypothetical protein UX89_C0002G0021 [Parcubacteria group bacterium GW2011_GWA2_47_16]|nr:MAG: hypothetical protein UX89_C0002G0021 [Parcubacteria group bacterium GW2011_GWA2_47_16]
MSTLSVPLTPQLEEAVNRLVKDGYGANKADVVRKAIKRLSEAEAVNAVLRAELEPTLKGDLRDLIKKI